MLPHVNIGKQLPSPYGVYTVFDEKVRAAAEDAGLPAALVELVRIRVSQLNGCGFCLRLHTRDAVAAGETADRLAVLPAWAETEYFTDQEKAALLLAEQVTHIDDPRRSAPGIDVADVLTEQEIAAVTWIAVAMNGWNRIAIASGYRVAP